MKQFLFRRHVLNWEYLLSIPSLLVRDSLWWLRHPLHTKHRTHLQAWQDLKTDSKVKGGFCSLLHDDSEDKLIQRRWWTNSGRLGYRSTRICSTYNYGLGRRYSVLAFTQGRGGPRLSVRGEPLSVLTRGP